MQPAPFPRPTASVLLGEEQVTHKPSIFDSSPLRTVNFYPERYDIFLHDNLTYVNNLMFF